MGRYSTLAAALVFSLAPIFGSSLHAQTPPEVQAAQALQEAGDYAAAADALRPYLQQYPDDTGTRWLFGRLLHWSGRHAEARTNYEAVVARTPDDPWLKLEYAQVLMALGELGEARNVLTGVFERGVPEATDQAAQHLQDIRFLTRPWIRLAAGGLDDNQPYRRFDGDLEAGFYVHPLWTLSGGGTPAFLDGVTSHWAGDAWGQLSGSVPSAHLALSLRGGATFQGEGTSPPVALPGGGQGSADPQSSRNGQSAFMGRGELGLGLPGGLTLSAAAERSRYLWTLVSLDSLVMVDAFEARLGRAHAPGWAGEAVARLDRYKDDNSVTTAYAWVLAPLVPSHIRLGYSFSYAHAQETRWEACPCATLPPEGSSLPGHYAPYFTPNDEVVHSALADLGAQAGRLSLKLNGSLGFHAREQAPVLVVTGLEPDPLPGEPAQLGTLFFYERDFTPWRATLTADLPVSDALTLTGSLEAWETAYYEVKQFGLSMVYRFGSEAGPGPTGGPGNAPTP